MADRTLILLRHGKSAWNTGADGDHERPLKARGTRDAARMGSWLLAQGWLPDLLVTSTAIRARATAELAAEAMGLESRRVLCDAEIYAASVNSLLRVVARHGNAHQRLMLVGHNPGLESLATYLCGAPIPATDDGKGFTTATLALLAVPGSWQALEFGTASLLELRRPREL